MTLSFSEIQLDSRIRDYATLSILLVYVCVNFIRTNLLQLTRDDPKVDMKQAAYNGILNRAKQLRSAGARFLSQRAYLNKKAYFVHKEHGKLTKPPVKKSSDNPLENMQQPDPSQAMGMMKGQMIFLVFQGGMGYWVSHLFNGFLVGKTPFPLTFRFKSMLQRGVEVENLEPGYISGLCWYFLIMMSLNGFIAFLQSLIADVTGASQATVDPNGQEDQLMLMMGMPPGMAGGGGANPLMGGPDMNKIFDTERQNVEIHLHMCVLDEIPKELHAKWKRGGSAAAGK